jgi:hypothetical protein
VGAVRGREPVAEAKEGSLIHSTGESSDSKSRVMDTELHAKTRKNNALTMLSSGP